MSPPTTSRPAPSGPAKNMSATSPLITGLSMFSQPTELNARKPMAPSGRCRRADSSGPAMLLVASITIRPASATVCAASTSGMAEPGTV